MKKVLFVVFLSMIAANAATDLQVTRLASVPITTSQHSHAVADWTKQKLYVTNSDNLYVIGMQSRLLEKTISLPFPVSELCISPSGILGMPAIVPSVVAILDPNKDESPQVVDAGIDMANRCAFSADGKTLYLSSEERYGIDIPPDRKKLSAVSTETWQVTKTWHVLDGSGIWKILPMPNGKLYLLTLSATSLSGDIRVLETDGSFKTIGLKLMPMAITPAPNGLAYVFLLSYSADQPSKTIAVDTSTDKVVDGWEWQTGLQYDVFPSDGDSWFAYKAYNAGSVANYVVGVNFAQKVNTLPGNSFEPAAIYDFTAKRQADGEKDTLVILREGGVDLLEAVQPTMLYSVVNSASYKSSVSPGMYGSIFGNKLTDGRTSADWTNPAKDKLVDASVKFCGITSQMIYAGVGQLNFIVPFGIDASTLCVVEVSTQFGTVQTSSKVLVQEESLSLFLLWGAVGGIPWPVPFPAMLDVQWRLLGPPVPGLEPAVRQPKRGDIVMAFGNGCGVKHPDFENTPYQGLPMAVFPKITVGGIEARVDWAGLVGTLPAECQFNFQVPPNLPVQDPQIPFQLCLEGGECYSFWVAAN